MIRSIDINLNAAHPELPLVEATTFTGAPSTVFIRGVPKSVGNWSITAVYVAVTYPDNSTTSRAAVESAEGVWVATIPGTATSGRTAAGFKIMADGIDENGAAVTGYVLGFADFSVLSFTPVPAPGGTFYLLRYFDQAPATQKEGDVAKIDGVLKFYNGSAWEPFAAEPTIDDAVTKDSANAVKSSGIWSAIWGALSALPTGFTSLYDWCVSQLAGKAADNAVVHTTGDETVGGDKSFTGQDYFYDFTVSHPQGQGYIRIYALPNEGRVRIDFSDPMSGSTGSLLMPVMPSSSGTLAVIENIAPDWMETTTVGTVFTAEQLCSFSGRMYRCILGYTFSGEEDTPSADTTHWAPATVEDVLKALRTALAGKENASNKVTSLTAQSTDAQYPSAKCVYGALQGAKPTRIYNAGGTDALDDKGQLFKSTLVSSESYWTAAGAVWTYVGKSQLATMSVQTYNWKHPSYQSYIAYDSNSGKMYNVRQPYAWDSAELEGFEQTAELNPSTGGVLSDMENVGLFYYDENSGWGIHTTNATFAPYSETRTFSTYAHFSLESLPDRTWAAGTWAVGDLVKYDGKAYRCKAATTASDTTAPSSDTTHWEEIPVLSEKAPLASPAFTGTPTAPTPTTGDNSTKVATTAFVQGAAPYALGTPIVINTASSETVEGETVYYGAATLADHTANIVQVTAATALDELRITFPAATSGKVRDFGLRVEIGTGSAALAAPALVPIAPTGETIKIENNAAEIPALADGTATAKGVTLLYFSENAPGVFVVKGEQVEEVA